MSIIKKNLIFVLLCISAISQAQNGKIYLLIDSGLAIIENKAVMDGYYECTLTVRTSGSTDAYSFTLQGDGIRGWEDTGQEIDVKSFDIYDKEKLKKLAPCDLHQQLSDKQTIFVKQDPVSGKYKSWLPFYMSTSKNRTVMKQKSKI